MTENAAGRRNVPAGGATSQGADGGARSVRVSVVPAAAEAGEVIAREVRDGRNAASVVTGGVVSGPTDRGMPAKMGVVTGGEVSGPNNTGTRTNEGHEGLGVRTAGPTRTNAETGRDRGIAAVAVQRSGRIASSDPRVAVMTEMDGEIRDPGA
jgi:hypothetical protein